MLIVLNPDKLTRQTFFQALINYLSQHSDVSLRQIKQEFGETEHLDRKLEDYIQAGYIERRERRYYLSLTPLESIDQLSLGDKVILDRDSSVYQELKSLVFETRLTNTTNEAILVEWTDFERNTLTLSNYFHRLRTSSPLSQEQRKLYAILGDVNPDYALKYMTSFLLKFANKDLVKQKRPDIFVQSLDQLGYIEEVEAGTYSLQLDFDREKLVFKAKH
ncbi:DUF1803 domain-containing protein [Streptococcus tangpeifui]|uniref:DUF1803 domain-containing protein n=1 Tax=Streptococcus tangpeifui TaxID=2709400 RepID=UPI0013ED86A9|nr:DUF1803 domain-containing protein [Streptococcus sp. ZJ1593]